MGSLSQPFLKRLAVNSTGADFIRMGILGVVLTPVSLYCLKALCASYAADSRGFC